ncbi:hypothetical protein [Paenibacillus dendritiformis]|uniref:hypothetical protein n=1 Tax=Paenibacillus dendritiformis TaxID=130049 RepID=UPI00387E04AA
MKILIADDEAHMLNILQAYFERERFRTFPAADSDQDAMYGQDTVKAKSALIYDGGSTRLPLQPREDFSNGGQGSGQKTIDDRPSYSYNTH